MPSRWDCFKIVRSAELTTNSEAETKHLAKSLAPHLVAGDIISLTGDLGAGKTKFVQGLAEGLGIAETVTSPTFTIIRQYEGRLPLYHFDVYRLTGPAGLIPLGYEEYFYGNGVTVIEWGDKVNNILPKDRLVIEIRRAGESPERRHLIVKAGGPHSQRLLKEIAEKR